MKMFRRPFNSSLVAGIIGFVAGAIAQAAINHWAGRPVLVDGALWGAVLGIVAASLPNFVRMGSLTVKSERPLVNLVAGLVVFVLISIVVVFAFYLIFSLLERLLA
jgi:hypothetical protein